MLPVSIDGVNWLATNYTIYNTSVIASVLMYVLFALSFCCVALMIVFFWFGLEENALMLFLATGFVCCIISFSVVCYGEKKNREDFIPEPISYIVCVEDDADYKALIQNYTIESEQDKLTTIILKEK